MRSQVWLLLVFIVGCSSGGGWYGDPVEAGLAVDAGPICCQITSNTVNDPMWNNKTYTCSSNDPPWICGSNNVDCADPSCNTAGLKCLGFNGTGLTIQCP